MKAVVEALERLERRLAQLEKAAKAPARTAWRPREVANQTGIGYESVLELIHSGELYAKKIGERLWVIPDAELQRFLAKRNTGDSAA